VTFLNDAWGGSGSTDRNLYVNDFVYLGTDTKDSAALYSNGTQKFSVTGGTAPTPTPTPTPTPSPDDTVITTGGSKPITDGTGNLWNIVNGQVTLNGTTDTTTANVVKLAFVRGTIWDETASNVWQYKATRTSAWAPPGGTTTPPISVVISANNQKQVVDATITQSATDAGATIDITAPGIATATLGSGSVTMAFAAMLTVNVTGGSGTSQVTLDGGTLSLNAGTGPITVSGGPGADAYSYHAGSGKLTISDFTVSQGDVLKIDSALQGAMKTSTDGSGGTLLTFGTSAGGIDLQGVTTLPSNGVKWV
jgi:hypothetical protein